MAEAKKNIKGRIASLNTYHTDAYAIAVRNGYKGTEAEWVRSLVGKSAYELAVKHGYKGTETEWLYYLAAQANALAMEYANLAKTSEENAATSAEAAEKANEAAQALLNGLAITQETGDSRSLVMSQKAVTGELTLVKTDIKTLKDIATPERAAEVDRLSIRSVTSVTTTAEMDAILANATADDVGRAFIYTGTDNSIYELCALYVIKEESE